MARRVPPAPELDADLIDGLKRETLHANGAAGAAAAAGDVHVRHVHTMKE